MKIPILVVLALALEIPFGKQSRDQYDNFAISKIVERAEIDFHNALMYKDQRAWVGRTVVAYGIIHAKPVIVPDNKEYFQISGSSNSGEPFNVVAFVDNPLPVPKNIGDQRPTVSKGVPVRVFGVLQKCRDLVDQSGHVLYLPTMECLLIFAGEDRSYTYPLWVSQTLNRRR